VARTRKTLGAQHLRQNANYVDAEPEAISAVPVLAAQDLSVGYAHTPVLRGLNLRVNAGEVVVLLGANGAGKTTTLLALAGELRATAGQALWNGAPTRAPLYQRARAGLRFVPEERSVVTSLTVTENLRLGGGSVRRAFEFFPELERLSSKKARLLSGGEQQMLTLARALSAQPVALLADELSLGLAPLIVARLLKAVRQAADEQGTAVLVVEQQVRSALKIADRGYVLRRGEIVLSGTGAQLFSQIDQIEMSYLSGVRTEPETGGASNV
jgi:branched-chain amino acid transport system ATP-binding protein